MMRQKLEAATGRRTIAVIDYTGPDKTAEMDGSGRVLPQDLMTIDGRCGARPAAGHAKPVPPIRYSSTAAPATPGCARGGGPVLLSL